MLYPTAQTSALSTAATASREFCAAPLVAALGVGMTVQEEPFQCSASVLTPAWPTAQTSVDEMADTADNVFENGSGFRLGTTSHGVGVEVGDGDGLGAGVGVGVGRCPDG